jgi:hypothetical protein
VAGFQFFFTLMLLPQKQKNRPRKSHAGSSFGPLATCLTWLQADRPNHHGIKVL